MKDVRLYSTENEKIAKELLGTDSNFTSVNMKENSLDSLIKKEKARKFNSEVEKYNEKLEQNNKDFEESQDKVEYDISKAEIKPMFSRILVQPFKVNPFQKMKVENGLIIDTGGYTPHTQLNEQTGRYEEQKQFIVTGCVVEVGPEVKYLKEGDVIFYRVDTAVPVPFFKQGFVSLAESQIIAVVNEGLQDRFDNIK
nr:MAG TPA: mHsp60, mHsp10, Mitochondrial, Chaperonin, Complex, Symmetric [Bacteriophage sp.]